MNFFWYQNRSKWKQVDEVFRVEFTPRGFRKCQQKIKLPPVGIEPMTMTTNGVEV